MPAKRAGHPRFPGLSSILWQRRPSWLPEASAKVCHSNVVAARTLRSSIMCGVAGVFHYRQHDRPVDRAIVARMTDALAHRGPNGAGMMVSGPIGFGHRRLSIIDLTETGSQPMTTPDGSLWICYNGEFYNHTGFRRELRSRHVFRGTSDTETLLYLFWERGPACFAEIMGIFQLLNRDLGITIIMITHEPDIASYAGRSIHFKDGRVVDDRKNLSPTLASEGKRNG